jgi:hypothetical protein
VVEDLAHYGNGLTVFRCGPQSLGYQSHADGGNAGGTGVNKRSGWARREWVNPPGVT